METWLDAVIKQKHGTTEEVRQQGFIWWMLDGEKEFITKSIQDKCYTFQMPFDREINDRRHRVTMQKQAQATHTGEDRWTNLDQNCYEMMSSNCAIVGMFVGYSPALGNKHTDLCESRADDAETTIDWEMMPPLCRQDDVDSKNWQVEEERQKRQKKEAGSSNAIGAADQHGDFSPDWD